MNHDLEPRALLMLNPAAGKGRLTQFAREAAAARPWMDLVETTCAGDCAHVVQRASEQGYSMLIVAGGDGTVHDVVNAMAGNFDRLRLAILPVGTANDLSQTLGLPRDPDAAMAMIEAGASRRIDLIRVESAAGMHYLINAASGGFSEAVTERLDDEQKERWGALAYLRVALDALPEAIMHRARIQLDDENHELQTCAIVVANGRYTGGVHVAPDAQIDDHQMDVGAVLAETIGDRARLMLKAFAGSHMADEHVFYRRATRLHVDADPPMQFNGDGEELGPTPMSFELLPGVLEVVVNGA